jgi:hypothetical protein
VLRATAQAAEARHWLQKAAGILAKEAATLPEEMQEGFKKAVALHRVILQQATHSD